MTPNYACWLLISVAVTGGCLADTTDTDPETEAAERTDHDRGRPGSREFRNAFGRFATQRADEAGDHGKAFFRPFGTNGRTCGTCHGESQAWTITPAHVQRLFRESRGKHPLFRTNDGSNSPDADTSTEAAREDAYSMLLSRAVIRVGLPMPANAEFELVAVDDPYLHASAAELSLFRRPLPSTNLSFIANVMWDGRVVGPSLDAALAAQADGATLGHAEATAPLPPDARAAIVAFETALTTAQTRDRGAGRLDRGDARGGLDALAVGERVAGRFDLYDAWLDVDADDPDHDQDHGCRTRRRRAAIARGQELFNNHRSATGRTCGGCHNTANVGTNVAGTFFDIGVAAGARRTTDQPLYTLRNRATGALRKTTDPGRALITGRWGDVDRFKVPGLRALAARAPYFHDGSAEAIDEVIVHYEEALQFVFTPEERADLRAFLAAL